MANAALLLNTEQLLLLLGQRADVARYMYIVYHLPVHQRFHFSLQQVLQYLCSYGARFNAGHLSRSLPPDI